MLVTLAILGLIVVVGYFARQKLTSWIQYAAIDSTGSGIVAEAIPGLDYQCTMSHDGSSPRTRFSSPLSLSGIVDTVCLLAELGK